MIEDEEQPQLLNTIGEYPNEEVGTIEEDIYVLGVESLNGKTGDLSIKTINGEDLVEEGNIDLQTPLDSDQMAAVNSGIDSTKVSQIATNTQNITTLQNTKQDKLTQTQLNAVNSGIDQTKVAQISTNTGNITSNTNRITTIEGKIPSAASSSNQLTDKNYVDNSIATNTANYISDNGMPFQSYADLEAYSGPLTNNDYAFVVSTDAAGNLLYTRYKYNASQELWAEEYTIANPTFTADQWAAINSGVTQNDVNQINTNKGDIAGLQTSKQDALSQTQLDAINSGIDATKVQQISDNTTAIATKQDKLVAGANIQIGPDGKTISATDTTYTAGTGLTLTGTQFSVTEPVPAGFFTDTAAEQTGTGSSITLNNTVDAPIDSAELKGDTYQFTTTGKNLMPKPLAGTTSGGIIWTVTSDTVTGSGTASSSASNISSYYDGNFPAGTYTFSITETCQYDVRALLLAADGTTSKTITIPAGSLSATETLSQTFVKARVGLAGWTATSSINVTIPNKFQLELGSQPTSFEPYTAGASPNPSYPQQIDTVTGEQTVTVTGKNLFDGQLESGFINGNTGANQSNADFMRCVGYIRVKPNTVYRISAENYPADSNYFWYEYKQDKTYNLISNKVNQDGVFTTNATTYYVRFRFITGYTNTSSKIMLSEGLTATAYEPYQGQSYKVNLGKNLIPLVNQDFTISDVRFYADGGSLKINGTASAEISTTNSSYKSNLSFSLKPGSYVVSCGDITNTMNIRLRKSVDDTQLALLAANAKSKTFTLDETTQVYIGVYIANGTVLNNLSAAIMTEFGSTATTYAPYFTPIELCKLGTYQDYIWKDGSDWKIHKAIGKVILDGSESWENWAAGSQTNTMAKRVLNFPTGIVYLSNTDSPAGKLEDTHFQLYAQNGIYNSDIEGMATNTGNLYVRINKTRLASVDSTGLKTWFSTHNTTVYYALATPTDTTITDATLIAQLEALAGSRTYSPQTNYSVLTPTPNLPTILTVDVFKNNYAGLLARLNKAGA